ncbi:MAG: tetratricopeptide repeat protein, partial [Candidatus Symbiothrix sp.]|nr:tetratricopeptide repeat protein [Candidatus Symbiothrix sp.]
MNTKKWISLAALFLSFTGIYAGNNERGIDLYRAELYDAAKIFFLEQTNQSPQEKAENLYYLGQTYFELQNSDSAAYYYKQAIETAPEYPFGHIGEGKLALTNDEKTAGDLFKKALSLAP